MPTRQTLTKHLIQERRRFPKATGDFNTLLFDVATACKRIAAAVSRGALAAHAGVVTRVNVQGEQQHDLDVIANETMLRSCEASGTLAAMASEELDDVLCHTARRIRAASYLLSFDPLDGSSNIDVNGVGRQRSSRSCARRRAARRACEAGLPAARHAPGRRRLRDLRRRDDARADARPRRARLHARPRLGEFILTHPDSAHPRAIRSEFAINASNSASGSRPCSAMSTNASPAGPVRAATTSTCAGSPRWWPRCIAS